MSEEKKILVLARNDHTEAMRVAGGLTMFGHSVEIVFVDRPIERRRKTSSRLSCWKLRR